LHDCKGLAVALIVAIDPGVNGGLALLDRDGLVTVQKMPGTDFEVVSFLVEVSNTAKEIDCYLEEPPLFAGKNIPGSAIGKLMWNTGILYGAAIAMGWKVHRIRPAIWMKAHSVGTKGERSTTEWKNVLKSRAAELFPSVDVTLWNADALLILDAAKRGAIN
jgi:hypothetical protein